MTSRLPRWTAGVALVLFGGSGAAQSASDTSPPIAARGRLIDVGGWRLHLNCTGQATLSQPTVILEAGIGDFSVEWSLVQPGVSTFARVCSYDRAGDGWSDIGPQPRTMRQQVYELHTLLDKAGEKPPYVMVGHSYGGWLVRTFRSTERSRHSRGRVRADAGGRGAVRSARERAATRQAAARRAAHAHVGVLAGEALDARQQPVRARGARGHHVQIDEPQLVVTTIQTVVAAARKP